MLVLWLTAGVLAGSEAVVEPPSIRIIGDDAPTYNWRKPFYEKQVKEVEEHLEAIATAARKAVKPRKRKQAVISAHAHVEALRASPIDLGPILAAIDAALEEMRRADADATALANAIIEQAREAEHIRLADFRLRKRDEEALFALLIH